MDSRSQDLNIPSLRVAVHREPAYQKLRDVQFIGIIAGLLLLSCMGVSCNESLPSYEEPKSLFAGTLTPEFRYRSGLWVHIDVRNTFDETLQGRERLTGTLEIVLMRDQQYRKTVALNSDFIVASAGVTRSYDQVTVNWGDTLKLLYKWDFYDDNGNFLPVDVFHVHGEPGFPDILVADPELFLIRGSFQVFDKRGQLTFQSTQYLLTYYY
jgi:hypothetical protein